MATVITNLLSAIPWIGTDFVQFVYIYIRRTTYNIIYFLYAIFTSYY